MGGFENLRSSETGGSSSWVAGSIQFSNWFSWFSSDWSNFFWDNTNKRLWIWTNTPWAPLHIVWRCYQTWLGNSTFFGFEAWLNDDLTNNSNTAFGYQAMKTNTIWYQNVAVWRSSLSTNTIWFSNIAIGSNSLSTNTTWYENIAIGILSLFTNATWYQNVAIWWLAWSYTSTFTDNITSSNSVYLGYDSRSWASGNTNEIVIWYSASWVGSNSVVLWNDSITKTILKWNIWLWTTTPNSKLQINGSLAIKRTATAVSVSSASEVIIAVTDTSTTRTITLSTSDMVDGRIMIIKDESGWAWTNNITIDTQWSELIDWVVNVAITTNYWVIRLYSNWTNRFSF